MTSLFFRFWKRKGITGALRELAGCETLSKNLVGTAGLALYLFYGLCFVNIVLNIFLVQACERLLGIWFKYVCNAYFRLTLPNFN